MQFVMMSQCVLVCKDQSVSFWNIIRGVCGRGRERERGGGRGISAGQEA